MFSLSNGVEFRTITIWYEDTKLGIIENTPNGYKFTKLNKEMAHPAEFYFQPLTDNSTHDEIVNYMKEQLTYTPLRDRRHTLFPAWVSTLLDEIYVTRGHFASLPERRLTFE